MGGSRLHGIVEFDVRKFGAPDNALLCFGGQCVPTGHIVQIFLHDHVAPASEEGIFGAQISGIDRRLRRWILRAIDKANEITVVEIAKTMHFIDQGNGLAEPGHDLRCQLETEIHALGANVKEKIAGCSDGMARAGFYFPKRMQFRRPRLTIEPVPCVGSNPHHAGEVSLNIAETDCT